MNQKEKILYSVGAICFLILVGSIIWVGLNLNSGGEAVATPNDVEEVDVEKAVEAAVKKALAENAAPAVESVKPASEIELKGGDPSVFQEGYDAFGVVKYPGEVIEGYGIVQKYPGAMELWEIPVGSTFVVQETGSAWAWIAETVPDEEHKRKVEMRSGGWDSIEEAPKEFFR